VKQERVKQNGRLFIPRAQHSPLAHHPSLNAGVWGCSENRFWKWAFIYPAPVAMIAVERVALNACLVRWLFGFGWA
jgi:hypothetical protein